MKQNKRILSLILYVIWLIWGLGWQIMQIGLANCTFQFLDSTALICSILKPIWYSPLMVIWYIPVRILIILVAIIVIANLIKKDQLENSNFKLKNYIAVIIFLLVMGSLLYSGISWLSNIGIPYSIYSNSVLAFFTTLILGIIGGVLLFKNTLKVNPKSKE